MRRLRQLEYFLAVWESGSLSAAAARLYVSQPSLSQQYARGRKNSSRYCSNADHMVLPSHRPDASSCPRPGVYCGPLRKTRYIRLSRGEAATCMCSPCGRSPPGYCRRARCGGTRCCDRSPSGARLLTSACARGRCSQWTARFRGRPRPDPWDGPAAIARLRTTLPRADTHWAPAPRSMLGTARSYTPAF
ncbi:LysR family transcriptional regulator [Nocardia beijingensis]|uniref:helix-turn-helix domain-containing protein n=1 Tax=Nocardia beijingensis TaxID=95162 RepID=UPI003329FAA3